MEEKIKNIVVGIYLLIGAFSGFVKGVQENAICHVKKEGRYLIPAEYDGDKKQILRKGENGIYEPVECPEDRLSYLMDNKNSAAKALFGDGRVFLAPGFIPGYFVGKGIMHINSASFENGRLKLQHPFFEDKYINMPLAGRYVSEKKFNEYVSANDASSLLTKLTTYKVIAGDKEEIRKVLGDVSENVNDKCNCVYLGLGR